MNLLELLNKNNTTNRAPAWRGTWARLWVKPSIFSAQSYIVGLAVFDSKGLCDFRFISDTDKFECIYDESGRYHIDQLIAQARQRLGFARENHTPVTTETMPPGLVIDPVGYVSGATAADAMESAVSEAEIPMEPKPDVSKAPRFKSRTAEEVIASVMDSVRVKIGLKAETFLREDHFGDQKHHASVNVALPNSAGIISSGWYAGADRVQLELLRAVTTVDSYMIHSKKTGTPGVFFLRPTTESGLKKDQSAAIENALDQLDWQLKQKGLRVLVREFESDLANDVAEWARA